MNKKELKDEIVSNLKRYYGKTVETATADDFYGAAALCLRGEIMEKKYALEDKDGRELFYISFEFLLGKSFKTNLINMGLESVFREAIDELGADFDGILAREADAGLGNGGLGRLAACFMDSLSTLSYPAFGLGIRYEYGLFKQKITDGYQTELPDKWLDSGGIWQIPRPDETVKVKFGGRVETDYTNGRLLFRHIPDMEVVAIPYDVAVTGYNSPRVNTLRLWRATSENDMNYSAFSGGMYAKAAEEKETAEAISRVLYPEDNHREGKMLRLRQQYFLASASMQWIINRHKKKYSTLKNLDEKIVIQINDTHPAVAIPETMRILIDEEGMDWDEAWDKTMHIFAYTNHTIMNEALEKWDVEMFRLILPRVYMIVEEISRRQTDNLRKIYGGDEGKINYMSVISGGFVNMANLCIASSFAVNGVSSLHTQILKTRIFRDYYNLDPSKFHSITNGISFRKWLIEANPGLYKLAEEYADGDLKKFKLLARDKEFVQRFYLVKKANKERLAKYISEHNGIEVDVNSIFDVQVKRLHEYKRQLLLVFYILYLYNEISDGRKDIVPRTFIFGAKASSGYRRAKLIIKLINSVAALVNGNENVSKYIKVVFIENYGVSAAQIIIPAADVSEQISTAGMEASGTGNMKFMLSGAVTCGTLDGANVEMLKEAGKRNVYIFGMNAQEAEESRREDRFKSRAIYFQNETVRRIVDMLTDGSLSGDDIHLFDDIYNSLVVGDSYGCDPYLVIQDFESYLSVQEKISKDFRSREVWIKRGIAGVAAASVFSSDRCIEEYNTKIWHLNKRFDNK